MAEKGTIVFTTGSLGDGLNPYTQQEWMDFLRRTFSGGANEGVLKSYAGGLAVTGTATPVSVAAGAAVAYAVPYENTAVVTVAIPTPTVSTRVDYIVLRLSWAAATVRITRIAGTEGAGAPALTQTPGTTYDIPLATASITIGGVITVTDQRVFLHPNIEITAAMILDATLNASKLNAAGVADGRRLTAKAAAGGGYLWIPDPSGFSVLFDGGGGVVLSQTECIFKMPADFVCTSVEVVSVAGVSGTISIDIRKANYASLFGWSAVRTVALAAAAKSQYAGLADAYTQGDWVSLKTSADATSIIKCAVAINGYYSQVA